MIVEWMIYGFVVSVLLGLAAWALEGVVGRWGMSRRWAWIAALMGVFVLPLVGSLLPESLRLAEGAAGEQTGIAALLPPITVAVDGGASAAGVAWDEIALLAWGLLSLLVGAHLFFSQRKLRRLVAPAKAEFLDGTPVWIADRAGPAVVGFFSPRIVMPRWALELDPSDRRLLVEHEKEHIRAGDLPLLLVGLLSTVLLPWNPATWWKVSRLRHAMEIDCDRRVLRSSRDLRSYGDLLLKVAGRPSPLPAGAVAFTPRVTQLERRFRAMTGSHKGNRWLVGTGMVAAAALLVLASCQVDRPTGLAPSVDAESSATMSREALVAGPTFTPYTDRPMLTNRQEYGTFLQQNYPPMLRDAGIGGTTILWVFIDEDGTVGNSRIVEGSGYPELDAVAQRAMGVARFTPAQYDAEPVPVWVQIPVTFQTAQ